MSSKLGGRGKREASYVAAMERVLAMLAHDSVEEYDRSMSGEIREIPIRSVLAYPYAPSRLAALEKRRPRGRKPSPIDVSAYKVCGRTYYVVKKGNHRTIAAMRAGHKTIRARVTAFVVLADPSSAGYFILDDDLLKMKSGRFVFGAGINYARLMSSKRLSCKELRILQALGISKYSSRNGD